VAAALRRALDGAGLAVTFLTILPLPVRAGHDGAGSAPAWYGLVGAGIGALAGSVFAASQPLLGPSVAAVLAVLALVLVTGGLHQDGLADCADALGVRDDRERRLRVMRDPAIGSFGTLALVLWALLMVSGLAQRSPSGAVAALVTAAAIGRFAALLHARWAAPARSDGLGRSFLPSLVAVGVTGATAFLVAALLDVTAAVSALLVGLLVAAAVSAWSRRTLGGRTGDTLGATVVLTEVLVVLLLAALARSSP